LGLFGIAVVGWAAFVNDPLGGEPMAVIAAKPPGAVKAVGIGSKDWRIIREISERVDLDWVMFACSLTVWSHPKELLDFIARLHSRGVGLINSAVFHAGFLTGGACEIVFLARKVPRHLQKTQCEAR